MLDLKLVFETNTPSIAEVAIGEPEALVRDQYPLAI